SRVANSNRSKIKSGTFGRPSSNLSPSHLEVNALTYSGEDPTCCAYTAMKVSIQLTVKTTFLLNIRLVLFYPGQFLYCPCKLFLANRLLKAVYIILDHNKSLGNFSLLTY